MKTVRSAPQTLTIASRGIVAFCIALNVSVTASADERSPADVFDRLQQNVWYLPTKTKDVRLYVTELGSGPPVIFLHGGPGNDFNYFIDAARPHIDRYRFIFFDQRGSLLSPVGAAQTKSVTLAVLVDDLEALRNSLGLERVVLLGHSFGTLLAEAYYQKYPEHVAGLVLAASMPPKTPEGGFSELFKTMRPRMAAMRQRPAIIATLKAAGLPTDAGTDTPRQHSERWRLLNLAATNIVHIDRWRSVQGGEVYYNGAVDEAVGDSVPQLFDLTTTITNHPVPIAVIDGDEDYLDPSAASWRIQATTSPQIRLTVIQGAGHYAWIDDPADFARAIEDGIKAATATAKRPIVRGNSE